MRLQPTDYLLNRRLLFTGWKIPEYSKDPLFSEFLKTAEIKKTLLANYIPDAENKFNVWKTNRLNSNIVESNPQMYGPFGNVTGFSNANRPYISPYYNNPYSRFSFSSAYAQVDPNQTELNNAVQSQNQVRYYSSPNQTRFSFRNA